MQNKKVHKFLFLKKLENPDNFENPNNIKSLNNKENDAIELDK